MVDVQQQAAAFNNEQRRLGKSVGGAPVDMNFNNSPIHCSSTDGSFIQDEDMHLILEFGGAYHHHHHNPMPYLASRPVGILNNGVGDLISAPGCKSPTVSPCSKSVGMASWLRRQATTYATQFDADVVAQLDFDDFSARRDMARLTFEGEDRRLDDGEAAAFDVDNNDGLRKRPRVLQNSLEVSLFDLSRSNYGAKSFFSSDPDVSAGILDLNDGRNVQHDLDFSKPAFISTDSLDLSTLSLCNEHHWSQTCAPNKCDYVLTFDRTANDGSATSVLGVFGTTATATNATIGVVGHDDVSNDNSNFEISNEVQTTSNARLNLPLLVCGETAAVAPQNSCTESQEDDLNSNVTTWGRIKRSYDRDSNDNLAGCQVPKFFSLPELHPAPTLLTTTRKEFRLSQNYSRPDSLGADADTVAAASAAGTSGGTLLKFFQRQRAGVDDLETTSGVGLLAESGYVTGAGSNLGNTLQHATGLHNLSADADAGADVCVQVQSHDVASQHQDLSRIEPKVFGLLSQPSDCRNFGVNNAPTATMVQAAHQDFEYAEFYVNGRYIDMNHNEIGYVPPETNPLRPVGATFENSNFGAKFENSNFGAVMPNLNEVLSLPVKPPRIFAPMIVAEREVNRDVSVQTDDDRLPTLMSHVTRRYSAGLDPDLIPSHVTLTADRASTAGIFPTSVPDLAFLKFPFDVPALQPTFTPFLVNFLGESTAKMLQDEKLQRMPHTPDDKKANRLPDPPKLATTIDASHSASTIRKGRDVPSVSANPGGDISEGPNHVQDWESLATLLPADVVKACRFFRRNADFLRNIDKPNCRSMSVKRRRSQVLRHCSKYCCCCSAQSQNRLLNVEVQFSDSLQLEMTRDKLDRLEDLVDKISGYCNDIQEHFRQSANRLADDHKRQTLLGTIVFNSLCPAVENLISDGLSDDRSILDVMNSSKIIDVATRSICSIIAIPPTRHTVDAATTGTGNDGERSLQFAVFVDSLLSSRALDVWLSNLISDRRLIADSYSKLAFMSLLATSAAADHFVERLIDATAGLRHLPFDRLHLVHVEISASADDESEIRAMVPPTVCSKTTNQKRPSDAASSDSDREGVTDLIVLQKELRIVFRFPPSPFKQNESSTRVDESSRNVIDESSVKINKLSNYPSADRCVATQLADSLSQYGQNRNDQLTQIHSESPDKGIYQYCDDSSKRKVGDSSTKNDNRSNTKSDDSSTKIKYHDYSSNEIMNDQSAKLIASGITKSKLDESSRKKERTNNSLIHTINSPPAKTNNDNDSTRNTSDEIAFHNRDDSSQEQEISNESRVQISNDESSRRFGDDFSAKTMAIVRPSYIGVQAPRPYRSPMTFLSSASPTKHVILSSPVRPSRLPSPLVAAKPTAVTSPFGFSARTMTSPLKIRTAGLSPASTTAIPQPATFANSRMWRTAVDRERERFGLCGGRKSASLDEATTRLNAAAIKTTVPALRTGSKSRIPAPKLHVIGSRIMSHHNHTGSRVG